ncbi:MAG TPA: glycosyltransferase, partial [Pseudobdellovibrionaceae bacterium]|nr:glycosyltransferase [Pseudobdellovibrionaceae bacterium]
MQEQLISVGIVARNEAHQIASLLAQLEKLPRRHIAEVIVVDNHSTDDTVRTVREWAAKHPEFSLRLFPLRRNHMANARNLVLKEAKTDWIYFTDADCRLEERGFSALMEALRDNQNLEKLAAIGGGNRPPAGSSFVSIGLEEMSRNYWGHFGSIQASPPKRKKQVELLSTCNFLLRKQTALRVQGFDSRYRRAGEDLSLSHRLRRHGYELMAIPDADVWHLQDRGLRLWCLKMFQYGQAQVQIAARYPRHFQGSRGLQPLVIAAALLSLMLVSPFWLGLVFLGYLGLLYGGRPLTRRNFFRRSQGVLFILMSH